MGYDKDDDDYYDEAMDDGYGYDAPQQSSGAGKIVLILVILVAVLGTFCAIAAIVAAIAIPNLLEARKNGNEAAAIGGLKTISSAQSLFREGDADNDSTLDYGSLDELAQVGYVDAVLGAGMKQGYEFEVEVVPEDPQFRWWAIARPVVPGTTGDRFFYIDETGIIYYSVQEPARGPLDPNKPPMGLTPVGR